MCKYCDGKVYEYSDRMSNEATNLTHGLLEEYRNRIKEISGFDYDSYLNRDGDYCDHSTELELSDELSTLAWLNMLGPRIRSNRWYIDPDYSELIFVGSGERIAVEYCPHCGRKIRSEES